MIFKTRGSSNMCRLIQQSINLVLCSLFLLTPIAWSRVWVVGHGPGDIPSIVDAVNDSSGEGDTVYVREGIWSYDSLGYRGIWIDNGQLVAGYPGTDRDSVIIDLVSISMHLGHLKGVYAYVSYFKLYSYWWWEDVTVEDCHIIGPIEMELWAYYDSTIIDTHACVKIFDCLVDSAGRESGGIHFDNLGISIEIFGSPSDTLYVRNLFVYRNNFKNLRRGLETYDNFWPEGDYTNCRGFNITYNWFGTTDTTEILNKIHNDGMSEYLWNPFLSEPFESLDYHTMDTLYPGIRYNNFINCDIIATSSGATSIEETIINDKISIGVFPNPFNTSCTIETPPGSMVEIYDILGKVVWQNDSPIRGNSVKWSPGSSVPTSVYFISVRSRLNKVFSSKVLLIR